MQRLLAPTILAFAFALTVGVAPAHSAFLATVVAIESSAPGGLTRYSYTVTDFPTSTGAVGEFDLSLPANARLTSFVMPNGFFNIYTPGDTTIAFESTSASTDLQPGQSGTFSFLSPDPPGSATYTLTDFGSGGKLSGAIAGPSAVPEPSSLALCGIAGLIGIGYRRIRRRPAS